MRVARLTLLGGLALSSGCAIFNHNVAQGRPSGRDCTSAIISIREAPGYAKELFTVFPGDRPASTYKQCPAPGGQPIPPDVASLWSQSEKSHGAVPIAAKLLGRGTQPMQGFLYTVSSYQLYFRGCDYWPWQREACQPSGATAANAPAKTSD